MKKNNVGKVLGVIAVIIVICGVLYALYRYFQPRLDEEFTDDLDDAFGSDDDNDDEFEDEDVD